MLLRKLALPLMLVATVSQAFATSIANISLGTPTNYNATYPVYWMQGDTFFTSWCSDNPTGNINGGVTSDIYTWINDANHLVFNSAEQLTNHLLDGTTANMVLGYLSNATVGAAPRGMALGPVFAKRQVIRQFGGEGETDATTTPYGGSRNRATQSGADYGNWKTAGLLCVNDGTGGVGTGGGTDYIFAIAMRTIYEANASNLSAYTSGNIFPWGQPAFNAQMITQSEAAGAGPGLPGSTTWSGFTPAPPSGAYHFKKPEWPSSPASTGAGSSGSFDAGFVQYGQGYSCRWNGFTGCTTLPDGASTYVYGVFPRENLAYGSSTMGIGRATISNLIAHASNPQASDWQFYVGGDSNQPGNWVSGITNAVAIINDPHHLSLGQPVYLPNANGVIGNGLYVIAVAYYVSNDPSAHPQGNDTAKTVEVFWQAPHPWGPWTKILSITQNPEGVYFPVIMAGSIAANSESFVILNAQNYLKPSDTGGGQYHLYETTATVTYH
jgi:hypothetical protein